MSRRCDLTGKTALVGHKVSHSNIKTKRRFLPNLLNVTLISDALGRRVRLRVSANALKSVDHRGGLDAFLLKAKDTDLAPRVLALKRQIVKKLEAKAGCAADRGKPASVSHHRKLQQQGALDQRKIIVRDERDDRLAGRIPVHGNAFHIVDLVSEIGLHHRASVDERPGLEIRERNAA